MQIALLTELTRAIFPILANAGMPQVALVTVVALAFEVERANFSRPGRRRTWSVNFLVALVMGVGALVLPRA